MKKLNRLCPVCGNCNDANRIYTCYMHNGLATFLPSTYDIIECKKCGMCYADTSATQKDYDMYYSECNNYAGVQSIKKQDEALYKSIVEELSRLVSNDASVIDIGFGRGDFLMFLRDVGYVNLSGIDPSSYSVEQIKKQGINAFIGNVYNVDEFPSVYNVAYLGGVIEHLLYPALAIKKIYKILKDDGLFIIVYPDFSDMSEDNYDIASNFNLEHINYFSKYTVDNLCIKNGFEPIKNIRCISFQSKDSTQYGIIGIYRKRDFAAYNQLKIPYDSVTATSINQYINRIKEKENSTIDIIKKYACDGKIVSVWGTGQYTLRLLATSALSECNIEYYIDSNPTKIGTIFEGKKIQAPDILKYFSGTLFVSSMMYADEIIKSVYKLNKNLEIIKL